MKSELVRIDVAASYSPDESPKAEQTATINGKEFAVKYNLVTRKCFDSLPTPTAMYKVDGKRVARKEAYRLAA